VTSKDNETKPQFAINAAVVFRLGEELITDVVQALVELVKNSYDADATWVQVTIDTHASNQLGRKYKEAPGFVLVEDDGDGMNRETIHQGWLTIAASAKREQKSRGEVTPLGRTPIGDKGLGRLGVQRLAQNVEIITRPKDSDSEFYVAFSWNDFRETENLDRVPVLLEEAVRKRPQGKGTSLILSGLREAEYWQQKQSVDELQRKLSGMISPFQEARDFVVQLNIDGKRIDLAEIAQSVRDTALLRYRFQFDGTAFHISGLARLEYFESNKEDDAALLRSLVRRDGGSALFEFLSSKAGKRRPEVFNRPKDSRWFLEFGADQQLDDIDKIVRIDKEAANPGPFRGEIDAVSLDREDIRSHAVDRVSEYRKLVRDLAGVRVYRDGFGIRVGDDWLGLGKQWTEGTSYYGLRPSNVLGYVSITGRENPKLIETTSREGFLVTAHYENFYRLLTEFVRFASEVQGFLRRGVVEFLNEHRDNSASVEPTETPSDITRRIDQVASQLTKQRGKLGAHASSLRNMAETAASSLKAVRKELKPALESDKRAAAAIKNLETALSDMESAVTKEEKVLADVDNTLEKAAELKPLREVLDRRWSTLQDELQSLYESVSLGLTAEALSHEINNTADRLARRSADLLRKLREGNAPRSAIVTFIEHVQSSVAALRKQLAHLTPSLRYLRERREVINIGEFTNEVLDFYRGRWKDKRILFNLTSKSAESFAVKMNKGKLTQIIDNLVLNSEYWVQEELSSGKLAKGEISFEIDRPVVRIFDNGRGVDPSVEGILFDPFVTRKRRGEGRGLGLFVVKQLLDSESCSILLLPDRNSRRRRYIFEIDFSGALNG
jgi:signal transduction histidine kinase